MNNSQEQEIEAMNSRFSAIIVLFAVLTMSFVAATVVAQSPGERREATEAVSYPEISLRNPLDRSGYVTSGAIHDLNREDDSYHHVYSGQSKYTLGVDVVADGTTAGKTVFFRAKPTSSSFQVRGVVIDGQDDSVVACSVGGAAAGGYRLRVAVEARKGSGPWMVMGYVSYYHVRSIVVDNGDVLRDGDPIARVTSDYLANGKCSDGPHLHFESSALPPSRPGYTSQSEEAGSTSSTREPISSLAKLFCLNGKNTSFWRC